MIEAGKKAPAFAMNDQDGKPVKLADFAGKNVVLYFYPKDDTPGCTVEACAFRDEHSKLEKKGAVVLGVSSDDEKSHQKFIKKFNLPFPLLVDTDHKAAEAFGAWGEKNMYGRKYMGIIRSTFLIGPDGVVKTVWPKVKVEGHVDEVLAALEGKASAPAAAAAAAAAPVPAKTKKKAAPVKKAAAPKKAAKPAAKKKKPAKR